MYGNVTLFSRILGTRNGLVLMRYCIGITLFATNPIKFVLVLVSGAVLMIFKI